MIAPNLLLILTALAGIGVLVVLITAVRLNPFLALLAAALFVGAGASKPMLMILQSFQDGLGSTLAGTAAVIGLGTMLGTLLAQSRGAEVLAKRFAAFFGPAALAGVLWRSPWWLG